MVKQVKKWLHKPTGKRFPLLFLVDPHDPYAAPKEIEKMFLKDTEEAPPDTFVEYNNDCPKAERDAIIALYDAPSVTPMVCLSGFGSTLRFEESRSDDGLTADHGEAWVSMASIFMRISFGRGYSRTALGVGTSLCAGQRPGSRNPSISRRPFLNCRGEGAFFTRTITP